MFDKFDADHSGSLDANEFATLVATLGGNMTKAEIDELAGVLKLLLRREQHEPRPTVPASVGDRLRE